jgi:hypothetical protein
MNGISSMKSIEGIEMQTEKWPSRRGIMRLLTGSSMIRMPASESCATRSAKQERHGYRTICGFI